MRRFFFLFFLFFFWPCLATTDSVANEAAVCGKDLSGDGYFDEEGEVIACVNDVCPHDTAECDSTYTAMDCPHGGTLDTERDMCHVPPVAINCPSGYTYDGEIDRCVRPIDCPEGGTYNPNTDRCEKLVVNECPAGYVYDAAQDICKKAVDCSPGTLHAGRDRCEMPPNWDCPSGYIYDAGPGKCVAAPACPEGSAYNPATDRCENAATNTCPSGYTYDSGLNECVRTADCPAPSVLNPATDRCEVAVTESCPSGYAMDAGTGVCYQAPTCTQGGVYNTTHNICTLPIAGTTCPSGYTWNSTHQTCVAPPVCVGGAYNTATNRCEAAPSFSCPDSSYTYNPSRGRCEKNPVCSQGTYSASYDKCLLDFTPNCPSGYSYVAVRNRCERPPVCESGTTWNPSLMRCQSSLPSCSTNYTFHSGRNRCESNAGSIICPSSYIYDGYSKKCIKIDNVTYSATPIYNMCTVKFNTPSCSASPGDRCPPSGDWNQYVFYFDSSCHITGYSNNYHGYGFTPLPVPPQACQANVCNLSAPGSYSCQPDHTLSGTTCSGVVITETNPCQGSNFDQTNNLCFTSATYATSFPSCPSGTMDYTNGVCHASYTPNCPAGTTYDAAANKCAQPAQCSSGGLLDGAVDKCYQAASGTCPSGYALSGGGCTRTPTCNGSGIFTAAIDQCIAAATFNCATGYAYSGSLDLCTRAAGCSSPGGLNPDRDRCEAAIITVCSPGFTKSGSICYASPSCLSPGAYSVGTDLCLGAGGMVCAPGFVYDGGHEVCRRDADCGAGTLNTAADRCEATATVNCGAWSWDGTNQVCHSAAVCDLGAYNTAANECRATITRNCGLYTWNAGAHKCVRTVSCPAPGTHSLSLDICVADANHQCPGNYAWTGLPLSRCEVVATCPTGSYDPDLDQCYEGDFACPLGNYTCADIDGSGVNRCSAFPCADVSTAEDVPADTSSYEDDGVIDPETGQCSGVFKIFNGRGSECLPRGASTTYFDCCDTDRDRFLIIEEHCPGASLTAVQAVQAGSAAYVGSYCKRRYPVIGCVQRAKMYCVFTSKMARIIHEQGRPQLQKFAPDGNWGSPDSPNCEGFTPEEFQMLDFGRIDLSELFGDLETAPPNLEQSIQNSLSNYPR